MTEQLIANWNVKVKTSDLVYHLGDFAISYGKRHYQLIDEILSRLNGQKFLIQGNHDRDEVVKNPRWIKVARYLELKLDLGGEHKQRIVMCHYALRTWNQAHRGAWMLYGHSHGHLIDIGGRTLDVGVDCQNYYPVSLAHLQEIMATRLFKPVDHHQPDESSDDNAGD